MNIADWKQTARRLGRSPGFASLTILVLALGIGANSAIFSIADAVLFRGLPVPEPDRLVRVGGAREKGKGFHNVSYPQFVDYRDHADLLAGLATFSNGSAVDFGIAGQHPARIAATVVSGNYFDVLRVGASVGRLLAVDDDRAPGGSSVLVVSDALWRRQFGADPGVVGRQVQLNGHPFAIVGVAPRGFFGATLEEIPDVWLPISMIDVVAPQMAELKPLERRGFTWLQLVGRLRPGISIAEVQAQLDVLSARRLAMSVPEPERDRAPWTRVVPARAATLDLDRQSTANRVAWILVGVAALVLLLASTVAASLLLVRGEQRRRELAIRAAIGGSRMQVAGEVLRETALLALAGAAAGLLLARWAADALKGAASGDFPLPVEAASPILDPRVLAFTAAISVVAAFLVGLAPALRSMRSDLAPAMRKESRGGFDSRFGTLSIGNALVVTQVALSALLLVGAGLLLRTLKNASAVELGFDAEKALLLRLDLSKEGYGRIAALDFHDRLLERVRGLSGVKDAALAFHVPVRDGTLQNSIALSNFTAPGEEDLHVAFTPVTPGFFRTLGIPIVRGRDFDERDRDESAGVIVNQAFVDRFWPGRDPLGERVLNFGEKGSAVVGVVPNVRNTGIREAPEPFLYVPLRAFYIPQLTLVVRTKGEPRAMLPAVMSEIAALDPRLPVYGIQTLREHVGAALSQERVLAETVSSFGLLALALAATGLYGVVAFTTQRRTREFGIRLAIGASPVDVLRRVVRQGLGLAVAGALLGLAVALATSQVLASLLFGVPATDTVTFAGIGLLLVGVAAAASAAPALRAARLDPVTVLRED